MTSVCKLSLCMRLCRLYKGYTYVSVCALVFATFIIWYFSVCLFRSQEQIHIFSLSLSLWRPLSLAPNSFHSFFFFGVVATAVENITFDFELHRIPSLPPQRNRTCNIAYVLQICVIRFLHFMTSAPSPPAYVCVCVYAIACVMILLILWWWRFVKHLMGSFILNFFSFFALLPYFCVCVCVIFNSTQLNLTWRTLSKCFVILLSFFVG